MNAARASTPTTKPSVPSATAGSPSCTAASNTAPPTTSTPPGRTATPAPLDTSEPWDIYGGAFAVGWFLHARTGSLHRIARHWPVYLVAAAVLSLGGLLLDKAVVGVVTYGAVIALAAWSWTFGLIGACTRLLRREIRPMRYLADASYWCYVMHLPIVVALGIAMEIGRAHV